MGALMEFGALLFACSYELGITSELMNPFTLLSVLAMFPLMQGFIRDEHMHLGQLLR